MGIIRKTQSVQMLLDEFQDDVGAISAIELIRRFASKLNKTTIYRVLNKLEEDGELHSFLDKDGIKWYAKRPNCVESKHVDIHPHFQCLVCGKVDCLELNVNIPDIPNREVTASQILIQGKCDACLA